MRFLRDPLAPASHPWVEGGGVDKQFAHGLAVGRIARDVAEAPKSEGKIRLVLGHGVEQVLHQRLVAVARREQADLLAQAGLIGGGEFFRECAERELRLLDRLVLVVGKQRQQAFGQPRQIPQRDARLVGIGVAAHLVDR